MWYVSRLVTGSLLLAAVAADASPQTQEHEFFERRIRPVLAEHCFTCHGPKKQMGGLRLDSGKALHKGGDNGPVVVPGDPEKSVLIQAVRQTDMLKMPPKGKLKPDAVAALVEWVKMGTPFPDSPATSSPAARVRTHWAFQPVQNPALPKVKAARWPRNPIDHFVLARLEAKGLTPSPRADRRTLLRRLTFDLIGLPPTPAEVAAFEADPAPDAWEKVVDRLLASPHYGERWGRHWLDVARYADTKGYVFFEEVNYPWAYTYRDYVIRALNEDVPYDQFILQQLAADQLPPLTSPAPPSVGGTGKVKGPEKGPLAAMGFLTLGGRFMNNEHDILDDRIDVVTRGLLGLTVTCARCHDHKFDPIPSRDYYALYGVFASSIEPTVPPLFTEPPTTGDYALFEQELTIREQKLTDFLQAKHAAVVAAARTRAAEYLLAAQAGHNRPSMDDFMLIADGNDLNPTMLTRWQAYLNRTRKSPHRVFALWHALAAVPEKEFATRAPEIIAGFAGPAINPLVLQAFTERPPKALAEAAQRYSELLNLVAKRGPAARRDQAQDEIWQVFHGPDAPPNVPRELFGELALLPDRPSQGQLKQLRKAVEDWRARGPGAPPRAMVLVDTPMPYQPHVFLRGNPNNLGDPVPRQFLEVLAGPARQPFRRGSGRLELAQAIADPRNPLTARVLVNRVWLHHFGAGLVRTPGDFGVRSDPPTHPELLDQLARFFMDNGWSIKKLHRLILLSAVYQQQSEDRAACRQHDPENTLLWKMNRRRLDFEATRDALLAVSGRLDRRVGGPSVRDTVASGPARRTLYGFLDRLNVPGLYRTFDFPMPDAMSPQRDTTTVAPQALFLMNHPFVLECARQLVQRSELAGEKDWSARVTNLYRRLYGRVPATEERRFASEFVGAAPDAVAVWERFAQALLVSNEFVFAD